MATFPITQAHTSGITNLLVPGRMADLLLKRRVPFSRVENKVLIDLSILSPSLRRLLHNKGLNRIVPVSEGLWEIQSGKEPLCIIEMQDYIKELIGIDQLATVIDRSEIAKLAAKYELNKITNSSMILVTHQRGHSISCREDNNFWIHLHAVPSERVIRAGGPKAWNQYVWPMASHLEPAGRIKTLIGIRSTPVAQLADLRNLYILVDVNAAIMSGQDTSPNVTMMFLEDIFIEVAKKLKKFVGGVDSAVDTVAEMLIKHDQDEMSELLSDTKVIHDQILKAQDEVSDLHTQLELKRAEYNKKMVYIEDEHERLKNEIQAIAKLDHVWKITYSKLADSFGISAITEPIIVSDGKKDRALGRFRITLYPKQSKLVVETVAGYILEYEGFTWYHPEIINGRFTDVRTSTAITNLISLKKYKEIFQACIATLRQNKKVSPWKEMVLMWPVYDNKKVKAEFTRMMEGLVTKTIADFVQVEG